MDHWESLRRSRSDALNRMVYSQDTSIFYVAPLRTGVTSERRVGRPSLNWPVKLHESGLEHLLIIPKLCGFDV